MLDSRPPYGEAERLRRTTDDIVGADHEVTELRRRFAAADAAGRQALLEAVHDRCRLVDYADGDAELSDADARVVIANRHGYALWSKYEAWLHLDAAVKDVIADARTGDLDGVRAVLAEVPEAANPLWVGGYEPLESDERPEIPNDSIPLFCVSEGVFRGTNPHGNDGDIARALLQAGADPDMAGQPMEGAVSFNCLGVVGALIEAGADLEGPAPGVFLAYPMLFGFTRICELLADAGVRLDLRFAAGLGRIDEMERSVGDDGRLKPDPGLADPFTCTAAARGEGAVRCERTDDVVLGQALLYACLHDRRDAAEWLIARGADVNALVRGTDVDTTVLHRMVTYSYGATYRKDYSQYLRRPMVQWLLDHGADPTIPDAMHRADAMHWAARSGMPGLGSLMLATQPRSRLVAAAPAHEPAIDAEIRDWGARLLVEADDIDGVLTYLGNNPGTGTQLLKWAGHLPDADGRLAQALIDAGIDPMEPRRSGGTPLHTACSFNNTGVARVLLDAGADPNWDDFANAGDTRPRDFTLEEGTPFEFACFFCYPRMVALLKDYGGRSHNLPMAAAAGDLGAVRAYFLDDGGLRTDAGARGPLPAPPPEPTFTDAAALVQTAFELAVVHGKADVVRFLLDEGVDVNATKSMEHMGAEFNHLEKQKVHPFIWATLLKHAEGRGYDDVAALLRERGATVEPR